tara:strand:+ start:9 stop:320 length:312 start_codon:yes stop_codon:yes gene_type:complete
MRYELGNLMGENPDVSALELLGYRIMAMRKEIDVLLNERDKLIDRNVAAGLELKELYRALEDATEALMAIEQVYTDGSDAYEDKNAMGAIARNFLHYRNNKQP